MNDGDRRPTAGRPRRWWRSVIAGTVFYVVLLATNYYTPWLGGGSLVWVYLKIVLVVLATFAAGQDLVGRPLGRNARIAVFAAAVLVLIWIVTLSAVWFISEMSDIAAAPILGLAVAIPVLPIVALALPGTIVHRRPAAPPL